jgi:hypothetical protein
MKGWSGRGSPTKAQDSDTVIERLPDLWLGFVKVITSRKCCSQRRLSKYSFFL